MLELHETLTVTFLIYFCVVSYGYANDVWIQVKSQVKFDFKVAYVINNNHDRTKEP